MDNDTIWLGDGWSETLQEMTREMLHSFGNLMLKHFGDDQEECYVVMKSPNNRLYVPENAAIPDEFKDYTYFLFTVKSYEAVGPKGLTFHTAHRTLDDLIKDKWAVD